MKKLIGYKTLLWLVLPACLPAFGACFDSAPKTTTSAAPAAPAVPVVESTPEEKVEPPAHKEPRYSYNPIGKRDPFKSYLAAEEENRQVMEKGSERHKTPLEKYTFDQLRLTAIISGTSRPLAMVEDPSNQGWTVHVGTRIGSNGGKVSAIMRSGIVITEEYRDAAGRKRKNKVTLSMPVEELNLGQ